MKKRIFPFLFLFVSVFYGQDTLTKQKATVKFGFSLGTHFTTNSRDNNSVVFGLVLQYKHWMLNAGPKIFIDRVYGSDGTWLRFSGFNADLRYVFGKPDARFRFFLNANVDQMTQKYNGKVYDYLPNSPLFQTYDQEYVDKTLCLNAGAGFHLKIVEKFCFSLNAGAGCSFFAQHDVWKNQTSHQIVHNVNETYMDNTAVSGLISAGIFYVIN